jgi:hypothetical protein
MRLPHGQALQRRITPCWPIEDQAHFLGATEIEVLADHLFEEQAAMHGPIEHLGQRELGLQDRDIIAIAGGPISTGERMWKQALDNGILSCADPARLQQICDGLSAENIDGLLRKWLRFEGDALAGELLLGVFVTL